MTCFLTIYQKKQKKSDIFRKKIGISLSDNGIINNFDDKYKILEPKKLKLQNLLFMFYGMPTSNPQHIAERLHAIVKTAIDGIITINQYGIIEFVNDATCRLFEYEPHEILGKNISVLMPNPHSQAHDMYVNRYLETKKARIIGIGREVNGLRKNGTTFPFRLAVSEFMLDNKIHFTGIVHDLSKQKEAEAEVHRLNEALAAKNQDLEAMVAARTQELNQVVEKLQESELHLQTALDNERETGRMKSRFVSMASHEFRTPLSTIQSSAQLMVGYKTAEQQPHRERHYQKIKSAVEQLIGILNDFLSVSKLDEGRVENNPEPFDLVEFCEEMQEEFYTFLKAGQRIIHESNQSDITVYLDKRLLKNIFTNLLSNAIKYSEKDTEIRCRIMRHHDSITLEVIDQGIGIPHEDKAHLFERFYRAGNATNINGTGLGLNIVQRYLDLMGGRISFESKLGKGTTFKIAFPL